MTRSHYTFFYLIYQVVQTRAGDLNKSYENSYIMAAGVSADEECW